MWRGWDFPKRGQPMLSNGGQLYWNHETLCDIMGAAVINLSSLHYTNNFHCRAIWLWWDDFRYVFHILPFIQPETWCQASIRCITANTNWSLAAPLKGCEFLWYFMEHMFLKTLCLHFFIGKNSSFLYIKTYFIEYKSLSDCLDWNFIEFVHSMSFITLRVTFTCTPTF